MRAQVPHHVGALGGACTRTHEPQTCHPCHAHMNTRYAHAISHTTSPTHVCVCRCPIMDTWWQTETGAHMITPLPRAMVHKPGSATLPFFGVQPAIVDEKGNVLQVCMRSVCMCMRVCARACACGRSFVCVRMPVRVFECRSWLWHEVHKSLSQPIPAAKPWLAACCQDSAEQTTCGPAGAHLQAHAKPHQGCCCRCCLVLLPGAGGDVAWCCCLVLLPMLPGAVARCWWGC